MAAAPLHSNVPPRTARGKVSEVWGIALLVTAVLETAAEGYCAWPWAGWFCWPEAVSSPGFSSGPVAPSSV